MGSSVSLRLHQEGFLWIEKYTDNMIKELHLRLEAPHLDINETNTLRGEIRRARCMVEDAKRAWQTGEVI